MNLIHLRSPFLASLSLFLAFLVLAGCSQSREVRRPTVPAADVLATFNGGTVTLAEFERQYARSVGGYERATQDSIEAYRDFLERYLDFRLKVQAARDAGLAQDSALQQEVATYRAQLARPYLLEQRVTEPLLKEMYARQQEVIDASHLLIRLQPGASPEDTLAAYQRIASLRDSVLMGIDFGDLAYRHSEDPSAQGNGLGARGHLGYFSGGRMVKAFEDWAFATPAGEVSPVFRTQYGYHLVYVHDRKAKPEDVHLAHLMIRVPGSSAADTAAALARLDSIRTMLAEGADFAELARTYSDDQGSARNGGDLGWVSFDSRLIEPLRGAAFALETGAVSEPILTQYGYHLLKVLERRPPPTYEEALPELNKTLARLPRSQQAHRRFAQKLQEQYHARVDTALVTRLFPMASADSTHRALKAGQVPDSLLATPFAWLGDSTYTLRDFVDYTRNNPIPRKEDGPSTLQEAVDLFMNYRAIDYEVAALEERDPAFRETMDEFRNGLLLFRLMEDSVWTAAAEDTLVLRRYYEAHAERYRFPDRARIIGLYHPSDSLLQAFRTRLMQGTSLEALWEEAQEQELPDLRLDTTYVSGETRSVFDKALALPAGEWTEVLPYNKEHVLLWHEGTEPARPKTFEEARAEVVNDYQKVLEDNLIRRLRTRYRAHTYPERLTMAFRKDMATEANTATQ